MSRYHLTPEMLLQAYAQGLFPMAEDRLNPTLYWVDPDYRGVIAMDEFHVPRRLARTVRRDPFAIRVNRAFRQVVEQCAAPSPGRMTTWINDEIIRAYCELNRMGFAHSVECWRDGTLVGGLYGVAIRGAFFGESMFSGATDSSKVALVHLMARLKIGGYALLDAQFVTDHLKQFGTREVSRALYRELLDEALSRSADFYRSPEVLSGALALQSATQTS